MARVWNRPSVTALYIGGGFSSAGQQTGDQKVSEIKVSRDVQLKEIEEKMKALLAEAAALGQIVREQTSQPLPKSDRSRADFRAPRFEAQWKLAQKFSGEFPNMPDEQRQRKANELARELWSNYTNRTEKSELGGGLTNVEHMILCGSSARKIIEDLQSRIDYWRSMSQEERGLNEDADQEGATKALRYLEVCGKAPKNPNDQDGDFKHYGRQATMVNGIPISRRGATNRDSQVAEAARMFRDYGEAALAPEILDAVLDNGGRYISKAQSGSPAFQKVRQSVERGLKDETLTLSERNVLNEIQRLILKT